MKNTTNAAANNTETTPPARRRGLSVKTGVKAGDEKQPHM